jgi:hypothetical protein
MYGPSMSIRSLLQKLGRRLTPPGNRTPLEESREQHPGATGVGEQATPAGDRNDRWLGGV